MLHFLQPIWLWTSIGIIVPIIIHLWNIQNGKTLKIGSIAFFQQITIQKKYSYKVTELLLLLIRCLLIIVLAFLLAKPILKSTKPLSEQKGWILISANKAPFIYKYYQSTIDSLLQNEYELRLFEPDFSEVSITTLLNLKDSNSNLNSYWYTLSLLNQQLTGTNSIYLFTDGNLRNFTGEKPIVKKSIKWFLFSNDKDRIDINKAYLNSNDSLVIQLLKTNNKETTFEYKTVANANSLFGSFVIDKQTYTLTDTLSKKKFLIDTSVHTIGIYADEWQLDKLYVTAALQSIKNVAKRKIEIVDLSTSFQKNKQLQTLFWLSNKAISKNIKANTIIQYNANVPIDTLFWLPTYELYQHQILPNNSLNSISLIDNLVSISKNNPHHYFLNIRLQPQFSPIVWNEQFPFFLLQLIDEKLLNQNEFYSNSNIEISPNQIQQSVTNSTNKESKNFVFNLQLQQLFWLLLLVLFVLERFCSHYLKKKESNY